ncbi:hypothetical protein Hanom_Chr14g01265071 [Helianthus anomalus]
MATNTKHGVSSYSKLKEKCVDEKKQPTESFTKFKNSTFEVSESSKVFYKRRAKLKKQKWVAKNSEVSSGDESDSSKSEEPEVDIKKKIQFRHWMMSTFHHCGLKKLNKKWEK